jgi:hypothetical protein
VAVWTRAHRLLSETATLATLDEAFAAQLSEGAVQTQRRAFPYLFMARWVAAPSLTREPATQVRDIRVVKLSSTSLG